MKYIINLIIVYTPSEKTLALHNDPSQKVNLSNPANRLLLELIRYNGKTLERETLLHNVWEEYGFTGSNSNLNTYISELRKSFSSLSENIKIITTVPKVGFRLEAEIEPALHPDAHAETRADAEVVAQRTTSPPQEELEMSEDKRNNADRQYSGVNNKAAPVEASTHTPPAVPNSSRQRSYKLGVVMAMAFALIAWLGYAYFHTPRLLKIVSEPYSYLFTLGGCEVYSLDYKNAYSKKTLIAMAKQDIAREKLDCQHIKNVIFYKKMWAEDKFNEVTFMGICSVTTTEKYERCFTIKNFAGN
ncbi:winged helix-turn-helix domain-containing protein [Serratia rubidaea]|nr:winged helix-turn-helix domain-containing protein [Serratia rubidaea]